MSKQGHAYRVLPDGTHEESAPLWCRLGMFQVPPRSRKEELQYLLRKIDEQILAPDTAKPLTGEDFRTLSGTLRTLLGKRSALALFETRRYADSSPGTAGWCMAIDYLARKELLGKAAAARLAVAIDWGCKETRVRDAVTTNGRPAKYQVRQLTEQFVGKYKVGYSDGRPTVYWTRTSVLEAIVLNLADWREWRTRQKSKRKAGRKK